MIDYLIIKYYNKIKYPIYKNYNNNIIIFTI